ncbi:RluA family pseudouridine synthase [Lachnoclostridium sp. Marseille-P6806]|uniref:RluA family pseudouridine synthase n=1 Tax=Lachnoclostridium sp. Marseille-P6806 TaxID=2364793 RepID=UPI0010327A99|nr:RluA family pseudouridine synthase [Lachnoclostridium sp. Marseille-P6806]
MDRILSYVLRQEDLASTAGGLVNLILKNCIGVTGHEIRHAKFTPGGITADGRSVTVKDRILPGQTLRVVLAEGSDSRVVPSDGALDILFEDEDVFVLNKPAGVVVHPTHGHYSDTLLNAAAGYYARQGRDAVCRVVGRLDRETSGVLVLAVNRAASGRLAAQRLAGSFRRTYLALAEGAVGEEGTEGTIDRPLEADPSSLFRQQTAPPGGGRRAVTHYHVEKVLLPPDNRCSRPVLSLLRLHIDTGRTHQIRVHMMSEGHPLYGDTLYGGTGPKQGGPGRALLHASEAEFIQPFTGERLRFSAPLPEDFRRAMQN